MKQADNFNPGQWLVENKLTNQSQLNEIKVANPVAGTNVEEILANVGADLDEILAEEEPMIETGTELWLAILEELTGKNQYNNNVEFTDEEEEKINNFVKTAREMGIRFV